MPTFTVRAEITTGGVGDHFHPIALSVTAVNAAAAQAEAAKAFRASRVIFMVTEIKEHEEATP